MYKILKRLELDLNNLNPPQFVQAVIPAWLKAYLPAFYIVTFWAHDKQNYRTSQFKISILLVVCTYVTYIQKYREDMQIIKCNNV